MTPPPLGKPSSGDLRSAIRKLRIRGSQVGSPWCVLVAPPPPLCLHSPAHPEIRWRAPEVEASSYNYKIDIFSLGVVYALFRRLDSSVLWRLMRAFNSYLEIITGAEGEEIRLSMSYQKPGSLKFGVNPHLLREVFREQVRPSDCSSLSCR